MSPYTHPEWLALLRAILAEPADDTARLVAADWLDDHGEGERAEFIRVQIELAHTSDHIRYGSGEDDVADNPRFFDLRRRERELYTPETALLWAGPPLATPEPGTPHPWFAHWQFRRGFVASITCTPKDWLAHAAALVAEHPITEVTLSTPPTLAEWPGGAGEPFGDFDARGGRFVWPVSWPGVTFHVGRRR